MFCTLPFTKPASFKTGCVDRVCESMNGSFTQVIHLQHFSNTATILSVACPPPTLSPSFAGPIIIFERSADWSAVRRMGTQVLLAADGLLHVCAHSADEDQPMVSANH